MTRLRLLGLLVCATSCGSGTGGGVRALVTYHLAAESDACIRVRAAPQLPVGQSKQSSFPLEGKPADGVARFGVLLAEDWSGDITLTATLHRPCASTAFLARDITKAKAPTGGKVVELELFLDEPALDGGSDGGQTDAGFDAGTDAGIDGGGDAGPQDAGTDAGVDGGFDAGPITCDGGIGYFAGPPGMGADWHDVALYGSNGVWLAGSGALFWRSANTWLSADDPSCAGQHFAAWARPDGRVYFGTLDAGLRYTDPSAATPCTPVSSGPFAPGDVYGIAGFVDGGTVTIYSATLSGNIQRSTDPDQPSRNRRWDLADAGVKQLWAISGRDENTLFAVGANVSGGDGVILKYNPVTDLWFRQVVTLPEIVNDVSVVSPTLAYAGTSGHDLFSWDGTTWTQANSNMFGKEIYGLQAFSATEVYAAGEDSFVKLWNGVAWTTIAAFDGGSANGYVARLRGNNACSLWGVGSKGLVIRSQ